MKNIENRKSILFKGVLSAVDKDLKLFDKREAQIVSLTFEKTFELVNRLVDSELRKSYMKKSKFKSKTPSSRLDSIK